MIEELLSELSREEYDNLMQKGDTSQLERLLFSKGIEPPMYRLKEWQRYRSLLAKNQRSPRQERRDSSTLFSQQMQADDLIRQVEPQLFQ